MGNYLREVRTVHTGNKLCLTTLCQLLLFFPSFWFFFCLRFLVSFLLLLAMPGNAILWLRCACAPASAPSPSTPHEANKSERDWERRQGQGKRDAKLSRAREIARWWHWLRASRKRETPRVRTNKRRQLEEISANATKGGVLTGSWRGWEWRRGCGEDAPPAAAAAATANHCRKANFGARGGLQRWQGSSWIRKRYYLPIFINNNSSEKTYSFGLQLFLSHFYHSLSGSKNFFRDAKYRKSKYIR